MNKKLELPDGSPSASDIQDYFNYIIKNMKQLADNPPKRICANQMENTITFRIKTGYYLKLLTPETLKLLESSKSKIFKDKYGKNVPLLEITEVVLVHCNIVNNVYQLYFISLVYVFSKNHLVNC